MNYMESSRDNQYFAQSTTPGMKTWLICYFVLLAACIGSPQTASAQVTQTPGTLTGTPATKVSPVATNAPPGQTYKLLQIQPLRSPTKSPHELAFKEPKANEMTLGRHTYTTLDERKWLPKHPDWEGREPSVFAPSNVSVNDGMLHLRNITMSTPEEAQKAIDGLNGKDLGGRALTVNIARPKEERSGGGGGRGGYGGGGRGGGRDRY